MTWSCYFGYINIAYNFRAILDVMDLAHCIDTTNIKPCLRRLISQNYTLTFEDLATYAKDSDPIHKGHSTRSRHLVLC